MKELAISNMANNLLTVCNLNQLVDHWNLQ